MCAICLLLNSNFCSVPLFWADSVPGPRDQICITTFYHQSNWCCWSILFLGHWNIFIKSSWKNTLSTPDAFINVLIKASLVNKVWPKMHQQRHPFNTYVKIAPNHPADLIIHKLGRHPWKNFVFKPLLIHCIRPAWYFSVWLKGRNVANWKIRRG